MALHLTEWQHRLMPAFLVAILPLFCFWFSYGMFGELSTVGIVMTILYILVGAILIKTSKVKESEEKDEPRKQGQDIAQLADLFRDNELYQWISGWCVAAIVFGLILTRSNESPISASTRWLVFGLHTLWSTAVFWFFYERSRKIKAREPQ